MTKREKIDALLFQFRIKCMGDNISGTLDKIQEYILDEIIKILEQK